MMQWHVLAKAAKLDCGTDGPFKVKGSSLWAVYSSIDSQSLTTAFNKCHRFFFFFGSPGNKSFYA